MSDLLYKSEIWIVALIVVGLLGKMIASFRKAKAARFKFLKENGWTISVEEIASGRVKIFGFRILHNPREVDGEVWALLQSGPEEFNFDQGLVIEHAKVVMFDSVTRSIHEIAKKLGVEVWDVAMETRPLIR